jgi:hypothetical protein
LSGFFASARITTASSAGDTSPLSRDGGIGCSSTCLDATATGLSAVNGGRPVSISYRTHPSEYRSDRWSIAPPCACSGERYDAVPRTAAVCSTVSFVVTRAMPKSVTFTWPSRVTMMLAGFTSRWMTPCPWATASASHTASASSTARSGMMRPPPDR